MPNERNRSAGHGARNLGLAVVLLMGSAGVVAAKDRSVQPADANQYYGLFEGLSGDPAPAQIDRRNFDHSGTRGREGLGDSPFHPEGPGNVSG
jgi:hypothetical protein